MNLSSGVGTTMLELVQLVFGAAGVEPQIEWKPAVAGEARVICGDPGALEALTGWRPDYSLREGIQTLLTERP
jgi:nucleoside-diphosphate-sugar epimerase